MPDYDITSPDGKTYTVTAPDGATQDQVLAYAKANYQHPAVAAGDTHTADFSGVQGSVSGQLPDQTVTASANDYRDAGMSVPGQLRTPDETTFQKINDFGNDLGDATAHHLGNLAVGSAQLLGHGITAATNAVSGSPSPMLDATNQNFDDFAKQREAQYQQNVPTNLASVAGAAIGETLPLALSAPARGLAALGEGAAKIIPQGSSAFAGGAKAIISGGTQGAVLGGLQPTTGDGSFEQQKAQQVGIGAALGGVGAGLTGAAGKIGDSLAPDLTSAKAQGIKVLQDAGVPLHLSQVTDSKLAKAVGSAATYLPFSGAGAAKEAQQVGFNRALSKTIGQDAPKLTDTVIANAKQDIGDQYNALFARNTVTIDPQAAQRLTSIANQASSDLPTANARVVHNQVDKFIDAAVKNNGQIPGPLYQNIRKSLQSIEGDTTHGYLVRDLRNQMESVAQQSFNPGDAQALQGLNEKYNNLKVIQKALGRVGGAADDVDPAKLYSLVNGKYGSTPQMRMLAKAGQNVIKDPIPDSGTAIRNSVYGAMGLSGAAAAHTAIPALAGGLAIGATAGRVLNSSRLAGIYNGIDGTTMNSLSGIPLQQIAPSVIQPKQKRNAR